MKINPTLKLVILVLFANAFISNAQQNYTITDFDRLIGQESTQTRNQQNFDYQEVENLKNLVFELNPLIVVQENEHAKMGDGPAKLVIVPSNYLSNISSLKTELQSLELILIKHSSDNSAATLDLNSLKSSALKYVLIECDFECSVANIQDMLKNTSNVKVLYRTTTEQ
ncbi:hypothetical protein APR41_18390 [Salegentibacter salinarum]|uniref:Uncharacterized protein n=1 Tax=Salegentibacter salinarum TaxID=447422 RepID=A0A2N0TSZ0_9FLAO|nr:hypothetical protein [Salegentibacter salinarum]PKD17860.1 hypothetical protein APR41_18390 [Salegentibacter salinarum]SKC00894.1 hypothetical protein SAMN05660903_03773 [Salegentibacter salinarum]